MAGAHDQFDFIAQLLGVVLAEALIQQRIIDALDDHGRLGDVIFAGFIQMNDVIDHVVDTLEAFAHPDRPGDGRALDTQHRFDLVQQFDRVRGLRGPAC